MSEPKWHDVPPVTGDYQVKFKNGDCHAVHLWSVTELEDDGHKFYGPLPAPPPLPPGPPRLLVATHKLSGERRYGVRFPNGMTHMFEANGSGKFREKCDDDMEFLYGNIEWLGGQPCD